MPDITLNDSVTVGLPDEKTFFEIDALDSLLEFDDMAAEIEKRNAQANGDAKNETQMRRDFCRAICDYVKKRHDVELTLGQADWLNDHLRILRAKKKTELVESTRSMLSSPSTSDSTPSA